MSTLFRNLTAIDASGERRGAWILVDGDTIAATGVGDPRAPGSAAADLVPHDADTVDVGSHVVTPGFIDLHGHGAGGHAFDDGAADIEAALRVHRQHGTTRSVLSLVANPLPALRGSLETIATLMRSDPLVLGAHLEGPFLSPDNRGAHRPDYLAVPDPATVASLLDVHPGVVRQITVAPELPHALDAIETVVDRGVVAAVGHTQADYETARAAFDRGATLLTHAFNAMPGIHHRAPGPIVAAIDDARVTLELILDTVHVHPSVARVLFEQAPDRVALITDAMAAAGASDGPYRLGSLDVTVREGTALLTEPLSHGVETIAGSTLLLDQALRHAIETLGLPPVDAVTALTRTPARALGLDGHLGLLAPGHAADLVVWDDEWNVQKVWAAGRRVESAPRS
ncbi:N-acetylglucosamine-6-phosphate deacetylase [Frondihabitans australicus]|uniref:N-acetylglucosamine-6-phosphate deacetylase n=1 Tax=Frondihabitans australicus TaxID=386892 RepID=A0A495IJ30_9MICO|nr:N-acetylglucosamine-6-phosphate deacetylase [Frondihabitans australicus]RKR75418.1 N-acetylglucosamine-6-phosphate deacetylase [Frondihabitans australicus]